MRDRPVWVETVNSLLPKADIHFWRHGIGIDGLGLTRNQWRFSIGMGGWFGVEYAPFLEIVR